MTSNCAGGLALALQTILLVGCSSDEPATKFRKLSAEESGVSFRNDLSESEAFNIIDYLYYYNGGGVALGDINGDNLVDIYFSSNEGANALYLNEGDLRFRDITASAGLLSKGPWKTGVSMVDVNGDGLLDIYQCRLGGYKGISGWNELYINNGDLTFTESAKEYGLNFSGFSTQAAFFDIDNDADLDVYLLNHSVHTPRSYGDTSLRAHVDSLAGDRLYRNDSGKFIDVSQEAGILRSQIGYGLGIGLSDIDNNGFTDIYVSNDFSENDYLYLNQEDGSFSESLTDWARHTSRFSMGNDLADFNNDGLVDLMTLDMLPEDEEIRKSSAGDDPYEIFKLKLSFGYMNQYSRNTLQLNRGNGTFTDIAMLAGVHATDWSWASLFADFDNDGLKDLFISNGIRRRPNDLDYIDFISSKQMQDNPEIADRTFFEAMPSGKVYNYFFQNKGQLRFEDVSENWGGLQQGITNGTSYADLDNDGDLDLVLNDLNSLSHILENTTDTASNFINVRIKGPGRNTNCIGCKLEVYQPAGLQFFENYPVRGFQSGISSTIHVGLGPNPQIDSLRIVYPGGMGLTVNEPDANQFLTIDQTRDSGITSDVLPNRRMVSEVDVGQIGPDFRHDENEFNEFNREPLIPHMHSTEGPALAVGDLNGDGMEDIFVGGAKHQAGQIFLQTSGGTFEKRDMAALVEDKTSEDVDAQCFDIDNDGDLDLFVVSGGNEFDGTSPHRKPRLYLNDGSGELTRSGFIGEVFLNGSVAAIYDYDQDGFKDIFLGAQTVPWNYGLSPKSFLLQNMAGAGLQDVSHILPDSGKLGMVNDAVWIPRKAGREASLALAMEWKDLAILSFGSGRFRKDQISGSAGWWKSLEVVDFEGDGDLDLLAGNLGLNSKLRASTEEPVRLYLQDFDSNGKLDQILTYYKAGIESIFPSKTELTGQLVYLKKIFRSHEAYAAATLGDVFGHSLAEADTLQAVELRSGVFLNNNGTFTFQPFTGLMQVSVLQDFLVSDFNGDGLKDILAGGNLYASSVQEGRYSEDIGSMLINSGDDFKRLENRRIGLRLEGDIRFIKEIVIGDRKHVIIARNNDSLLCLEIKAPNLDQSLNLYLR